MNQTKNEEKYNHMRERGVRREREGTGVAILNQTFRFQVSINKKREKEVLKVIIRI